MFCGREEAAKARMVINNTRPGYGLHHGHNIVLVTVSEVSAENLAMKSTVELLRRIPSKSPSATIWAQSCLGWAIFQSAESRS